MKELISKINVCYENSAGNSALRSTILPSIILREIYPLVHEGTPYSEDVLLEASEVLSTLPSIKAARIIPHKEIESSSGCDIEIDVIIQESLRKSAEVEFEWTSSSWLPGGSIFLENSNIDGKGQSISTSISTSNFVHPQDDLGLKASWHFPHVHKISDSRHMSLHLTALKTRSLSPALNPEPQNMEDYGAVWVDREGVKAVIQERMAKRSLFSLGVVLEKVTARDESGCQVASVQRTMPDGSLQSGPATCHSRAGSDFLSFLQLNLTRDHTEQYSGTTVGSRDILQANQSFGLPFFHQSKLRATRFIPLPLLPWMSRSNNLDSRSNQWVPKDPKVPNSSKPAVLVLHGEAGLSLGDLPPYDLFPLGGPHSLRGFGLGELGCSPGVLQFAAELQVPFLSNYLTCFAEFGAGYGLPRFGGESLTCFFGKRAEGSSYGVGVKFPFGVRAELIHDSNSRAFSIYSHFGDRF